MEKSANNDKSNNENDILKEFLGDSVNMDIEINTNVLFNDILHNTQEVAKENETNLGLLAYFGARFSPKKVFFLAITKLLVGLHHPDFK